MSTSAPTGPGTRSRHREGRRILCSPTRLLAFMSLTACTPTAAPTRQTPAPPPSLDLAAIVAPAAVRPEMIAPLTTILRGGHGEVLLPLGQDTLRCEFAAGETLARVTCDGETEEASDAPALVRKLHTGDLQVRVLRSRLDDDALFQERTGLVLPVSVASVVESSKGEPPGRYLGDELRYVRFEVSEGGEVVRARFQGLDGEEVIEAGSLLTLGQRLRERREALTGERRQRGIRSEERQRIATVFKTLRLTRDESKLWWSLEGVMAGMSAARQPVLSGAPSAGHTQVGKVWPARWRSAELTLDHGYAPGWMSRLVWVESFDGQVTSVTSRGHWRANKQADEDLDCAAHDAWFGARPPGLIRRSERVAARCEWRRRVGDSEIVLTLDAELIELTTRWQPDKVEAREREAARVLADREHRAACTRCASTRQRVATLDIDHRSAFDRYRILSVDMKRCTMRIVVHGDTEEQDVGCE